MKSKLYKNKTWLWKEHYTKHKGIVQIAKEQGVQPMTIRRQMQEFDMKIVKN